jgi:ribonuclease P protein component
MLKKAHRLKSRRDFKRTLAGRRICANDCFVLYGLAANPVAGSSAVATPPAEPRVGFIVSKKVHKNSTHRNRIKRRMRELVRTFLLTEKREAVSRFRTLVFIARNGSLTASYQDLKNRMDRCFRNP